MRAIFNNLFMTFTSEKFNTGLNDRRDSFVNTCRGSGGDENRHDALISTFRKQRTIFRMLCFEKKNLERLMHYTVMSLTNPHTICGRPTLKDAVTDPGEGPGAPTYF